MENKVKSKAVPMIRLMAILGPLLCGAAIFSRAPASAAVGASQLPMAAPQPQDPVAAAIERLKDKNPMVRRQAAGQLGMLRDGRAVGALLERLEDDNAYVRSAAVDSLGLLRAPGAASKIAGLMIRDKDPQVRQSAALALSYLADPSTEDALIQALQDSQPGVRLASARVLGSLRSVKALSSLRKMLQEKGVEVRRGAANALGLIGSQEATKDLSDALRDPDAVVRAEAAKGLGMIKDASTASALEEILKKDPDMGVRVQAAKSLGWMGNATGAPLGLSLLKDADSSRRRDGAAILAIAGDKEKAFPALDRAAAAEKDPMTQQAMEFSLAQMGARLKVQRAPQPKAGPASQ